MFERLKGMIERNRQLREIEGMDAERAARLIMTARAPWFESME